MSDRMHRHGPRAEAFSPPAPAPAPAPVEAPAPPGPAAAHFSAADVMPGSPSVDAARAHVASQWAERPSPFGTAAGYGAIPGRPAIGGNGALARTVNSFLADPAAAAAPISDVNGADRSAPATDPGLAAQQTIVHAPTVTIPHS